MAKEATYAEIETRAGAGLTQEALPEATNTHLNIGYSIYRAINNTATLVF